MSTILAVSAGLEGQVGNGGPVAVDPRIEFILVRLRAACEYTSGKGIGPRGRRQPYPKGI